MLGLAGEPSLSTHALSAGGRMRASLPILQSLPEGAGVVRTFAWSHRAAFTVAELLVVTGVLALLLAIIIPPLQIARRQAMHTHCSAQLQQLGRALEAALTEYRFYPYWDDGGAPIRYTWIDVLIQLRLVGSSGSYGSATVRPDGDAYPKAESPADASRLGYCPLDGRPDPLNAARNRELIYPPTGRFGGVDYSYGIGVPLAAGGWAAQGGGDSDGPGQTRRFQGHDLRTSGRVLAADAYASGVYNLSGDALISGVWNDPTQFDNTVAWQRHAPAGGGEAGGANVLFQDGHVSRLRYEPHAESPVNTGLAFLWYPGESLHVGPSDRFENTWYPDQLPPSFASRPPGESFPNELLPAWYTLYHRWTLIRHK